MRVLSSGQSNAIGQNTGGNSTFIPSVHVWNNTYNQTAGGTAFVAPALGSNPFNTLAANNNIGVQFCNLMAQYLSKDIYYLLDGHTGQPISYWSGNVTPDIITQWHAAFGTTSPADVFIWHQGENDSTAPGGSGTSLSAYQASFNAMLSSLTSAGVIDSNTKILIGELCHDIPQFVTFNTGVLANLGYPLISSLGLPSGGDNIHFTGQALCDFAQRFFNQTRGNFMTFNPVYYSTGSGLAQVDNGSGPVALNATNVANAAMYTNVKNYGAIGDGTTDDTAAIASALSAMPDGGVLYFPATTNGYLVKGSGSAIFSVTSNKRVNILGDGYGSQIIVDSTVPSTRDVFYFAPSGAGNSGYSIRDINIRPNSGTPARHAIFLDTTATTTTEMWYWHIENVRIEPFNGYSLYVKNNATNLTGGVFNSQFKRINCSSMRFEYVGDDIDVDQCTIGGPGVAIYWSQIIGAGAFRVTRCALSSSAGWIQCDSGVHPIIAWNELESHGTTTETNNAMIDILGGIVPVWQPHIFGNQIVSLPSTGNPVPIRIGAATGAAIDGNWLYVSSSYNHVVNSASAVGTVIGAMNQYVTNGTVGGIALSDSGTGTQTVSTSGGSTAITGLVTAGTNCTLTGSGTSGSPYNISAATGLANITGLVTAGSNVTITGSGTSGSPYSIASTGGGGGSLTWYVTSTPLTLSTSTNHVYTAAHGLGAIPKIMSAWIVCNSAEGNYSVGDEFKLASYDNASTRQLGMWADATNCGFSVSIISGIIQITDKSSGGGFNITPSKWGLRFKASLG